MYAVVKIAGFQYLVREGDVVVVPRLGGEPGSQVRFEDVLMVRTDERVIIGKPIVDNAHVEGNIVDHHHGDKGTIFKFIRRENYRRKKGHRQLLTQVKITKISYEQ